MDAFNSSFVRGMACSFNVCVACISAYWPAHVALAIGVVAIEIMARVDAARYESPTP